jgi:Carboxypeptidase regulatory-like domain
MAFLTIENERDKMRPNQQSTLSATLCRLLCAGFLFFITGSTCVLAQFDSATVLGTIRDTNGAAIPGATVTLKNIATGLSLTAQTDASGDFLFSNVRINLSRQR